MADSSERDRRRLGDATRERIDDLAEGWEVAAQANRSSARDDDATVLQSGPSPIVAGTPLREPSRLPRQAGLLGDVRYVFTSLLGGARARREHAALREQIDAERAQRSKRVLALARRIIADTNVELRTVRVARESLTDIAEAQSQRVGGVAGADAELQNLERSRSEQAEQNIASIRTLETGLEEVAKRLEPLERRAAKARAKAAKLGDSISEIDRQIAREEASLVAVKGPRNDPASVEARLAALRADGDALRREQPAISAELDEVEPIIAGLTATRDETRAKIEAQTTEEREAQVRSDEMIAAVRARRAVEQRAVREVERDRDAALLALGEQLCVDRPPQLTGDLASIDEHEVTIATLERRAIELLELVESIDKAAVIRGGLVLAAAALGLAAVAWLLLR